MLGRRPRSLLDLVRLDISHRVTTNQEKQKVAHDIHSKQRSFAVGDLVYIRDFPHAKSWIPGTIESVCGSFTYWIRLSDGRSFRRHIDHIRARLAGESESSAPLSSECDFPILPDLASTPSQHSPEPVDQPTSSLRRSARVSVPPNRLEPST